MTDFLSSEEGEESSGTKPNFIGQIVESDFDHEEYGPSEQYRDDDATYFDHPYTIDVIATKDDDGEWEQSDWDNLTQFGIKMTSNFESKWMVLVGHLENIHGPLSDNGIGSYDDLADFLRERHYEFREIGWEEDEEFTWEESPDKKTKNFSEMFGDSENPPSELIVPVREVSDEELQDLGIEADTGEVEEVEMDGL